MPNYTLLELPSRAAHALSTHATYVKELDVKFQRRHAYRKENTIPVLAFCGYGRAGKDTAAEWWCKLTGLEYVGSVSKIVLPLWATMAEVTPDEMWESRHKNKEFCIKASHALRERDLTLFVRMALGAGDCLVGPRCGRELHEARSLEYYDRSYWIENNKVGRDVTVEFNKDDCDAVLLNNASKHELYDRIERLYKFVRGSFKKEVAK